MALHPEFPASPYAPLNPEHRWFPADEAFRDTAYEKLLPPFVAKIREAVQDWRARNYQGASETPRSLLEWWFEREHLPEQADGSTYTPDFLVKDTDGGIWIIETKGREELDLPQKMARLRQWCGDATEACREDGGIPFRFLYVDQEGFTRHATKTLQALASSFTEYQEARA